MCRYKALGFTLIETLVALLVISIALAAALKTTHSAIDMASQMKNRSMANWVASNVIQSLDAAHIFPELGTSDGESRQGNHLFRWRQEVSITPNFSFRRVEVKIFAEDQPDYVLARQVSYVSRIEDK